MPTKRVKRKPSIKAIIAKSEAIHEKWRIKLATEMGWPILTPSAQKVLEAAERWNEKKFAVRTVNALEDAVNNWKRSKS